MHYITLVIILSGLMPSSVQAQQHRVFHYSPRTTHRIVHISTSTSPVLPTPPSSPLAASSAPPAVTPPALPVASYAEQVEQAVFLKIAAVRTANALPPLSWDAALAKIARSHSADMATKQYFSHTAPTGCDVSCRLAAAGYAWQSYGENIYMMRGYTQSADAAAQMIVDGWMNSPGHRANILSAKFTNEGVGVAQSGNALYATQEFSRPR